MQNAECNASRKKTQYFYPHLLPPSLILPTPTLLLSNPPAFPNVSANCTWDRVWLAHTLAVARMMLMITVGVGLAFSIQCGAWTCRCRASDMHMPWRSLLPCSALINRCIRVWWWLCLGAVKSKRDECLQQDVARTSSTSTNTRSLIGTQQEGLGPNLEANLAWNGLLMCAYAWERNRYRIEQIRDASDRDALHTIARGGKKK